MTWTWCDVVSNSRRMKAACDCFKMFRFSVMQSLFSFSNIEILAVPTASLIQNFLLTVGNGWFYLCREIETWCALKSNPKVNAAITFIKAGFRGTKQNCYQTTPPKELRFKKEYLILFFFPVDGAPSRTAEKEHSSPTSWGKKSPSAKPNKLESNPALTVLEFHQQMLLYLIFYILPLFLVLVFRVVAWIGW